MRRGLAISRRASVCCAGLGTRARRSTHRPFRQSAALSLVALTLGARPAAADEPVGGTDLKLRDLLVITATLHEQSVLDAPAAISVVTAEDIAARGYRSLAEILADTVGFNEVSDRNEETIGTRGVFASTTNKTLFLVDGHRMNDLLLGRYNVDQYLGLDAVERIELIRGPVAPLYGTGALVGVVNIITKKGRDVDGARLKYTGGPYTNEASFTWGKLVGDYDLFFNFTYRDQRGQEIDQPAEKDVVDTNAVPKQDKMPGKIYWRRYPENLSGMLEVRTEDSSIIGRGSHFRRITPRGANGSFYVYDQEPLIPSFTENDMFIDYRKSWTLGVNDALKLTLNPSVHHFDYFEQSYLNFGANRQPIYGSRSGTLAEMNNYQLKLTADRTFMDNLSGTVGFDGLLASMYRTDRFNIEGVGTDQKVVITPQGYAPSGHWSVAGLWAQVVWSPIKLLTVTAGARYDLFVFTDKTEARPTPRLGLVWRPRDELAFKLLYGESYLAPEYGHRLSKDPEFIGNKDLSPETFRGGDLVAMYQGRRLGLMGDFYVNRVDRLINVFTHGAGNYQNTAPSLAMGLDNRVDRVINVLTIGGGNYQNSGPSLYMGLDATAEAQITSWVRLNAGYSLILSAQDDVPSAAQPNGPSPLVVGGDILNVPRHTVRYGLRLDPPVVRGLTFSLWGRFTATTRTSDPILKPKAPTDASIPAVFVFDACILYNWNKLTLQLLATNLADTYYERGGTVPRPLARNGFMLEASFAYHF
jgi:outer membrane receptor for ferrienterochelin and colicin